MNQNNVPRRMILLSEDVSSSSVKDIMNLIIEVNAYDDEQEKQIVDYKREPIRFTINTYGGSAHGMLALASVMKESKTPIHTYGYGAIMSAGFGLFVLGHKRFADETTCFMYHGVNYGCWGTLPHHEQELEHSKMLQKFYDNIILDNTEMDKREMKETVEHSKYLYLYGKDAIDKGVADELITEGLKRKRSA